MAKAAPAQSSTGNLHVVSAMMNQALAESTGLGPYKRKLATYWTLATHALPGLAVFPLLALRGRFGCGKSETLKIVCNYAHKPRKLSMRGATLASIRDELSRSYEGTIVLEEADSAWKDPERTVENLLSDRYSRESAEETHKTANPKGAWSQQTSKFFGATVLHRRQTFRDPALDGRTIAIKFKPKTDRTYKEFCPLSLTDPQHEINKEGQKLAGALIFALPEFESIQGVAGRVMNTYRPILAMAALLKDQEFLDASRECLDLETQKMKDDQGCEPDELVLSAIIGRIFADDTPSWTSQKLSVLSHIIQDESKEFMTPHQISTVAKGLGFDVKRSHGNFVVLPTRKTVISAAQSIEYGDPAIERLIKESAKENHKERTQESISEVKESTRSTRFRYKT